MKKMISLITLFVRQRDHNPHTIGLAGRVSDKDMQGIRDRISEEFIKVFTQELSTRSGHQMVTQGGKADANRILRRWAIILNTHLADIKAGSAQQ